MSTAGSVDNNRNNESFSFPEHMLKWDIDDEIGFGILDQWYSESEEETCVQYSREEGPTNNDEASIQLPPFCTLVDYREFPHYKFYYNEYITDIVPPKFSAFGIPLREDIMLEVCLPRESIPIEKLILLVTDAQIDLDTNFYCLRLPLKYKIDSERYYAVFDCDRRKLYLYLCLKSVSPTSHIKNFQ